MQLKLAVKLRRFFGSACKKLQHYQDDIFVGGGSIPERDEMMSALEQFANYNNLAVNPDKIQTSESQSGINVLGINLRNGVLMMPVDKQMKIKTWIESMVTIRSVTRRRLYQLLGLVNFFRHFGENVSSVFWAMLTRMEEISDNLKNLSANMETILSTIGRVDDRIKILENGSTSAAQTALQSPVVTVDDELDTVAKGTNGPSAGGVIDQC
mmetsp:Transcript_1629/g.1934  ORF Transcript_1629/g.1934 Transcript_1629/m.1934 type:complete len:211 (-) Transcript_1629:88-720(-)